MYFDLDFVKKKRWDGNRAACKIIVLMIIDSMWEELIIEIFTIDNK